MEPDERPVKARRRISPTLLSNSGSESASPGFRVANPDAYRMFTTNGDILPDLEIQPADITSKKRTRPSSDLGPTELAKKSKQWGGTSGCHPSALEPFYFLITTSPRYWACAYESLCDWMQQAINQTLSVAETPFELPESASQICLASTSPARDHWQHLLAELREPDHLEDLWAKLTVVDKILTMFGDEEWSDRNASFFSLQHNVWWVTQVRPWFSLSHVRTCQEYLQTAMAALALELWWRFVWARHTKTRFMAAAPVPASGEHGTQSTAMIMGSTIADASFMGSEDTDEVLDQSELGERSDTASEVSAADSEVDAGDTDEAALQSEENSKMKAFFSVADSASHNNVLKEESEESAEDSNSLDADSSSSSSSGQNDHHDPHAMIESEAVAVRGAPSPDPNWFSSIPPSTPLFFAHSLIDDAIDTIERNFWVTERWECRLAFETLLKMTIDRNADLQLPEQSTALIVSHMQHAYNKVFVPFLQQMGIELTPQTVEYEGLFDSVPTTWSFNPAFGDYWVDVVLTCTFANLTTGGIVPSVNFVGLFPQLLLNADSKSDAQVLRVTENLHARLVARGTITPQLETLVKSLDSLTAERSTLLRQNSKLIRQAQAAMNANGARPSIIDGQSAEDAHEEDQEAIQFSFDPASLDGRLHAHRMQRIKQIETMLDEIRVEFNRLTGSVDQVPTKRRRKTKTESALDLGNFSSNTSNSLPSDEALWGLNM